MQNQLQRHGTTISDNILRFKLLKAANISVHHKQFIKTNYNNIAKKIKFIFSSETETSKQNNKELNSKYEKNYYTKETKFQEEEFENDNENHNGLCDAYLHLWKEKKMINKFTFQNQPHTTNKSQHKLPPKASSWRNRQPNKPIKEWNPHKSGQLTRCNNCQSIKVTYLYYKKITCQNVSSEAQVMNFFIL